MYNETIHKRKVKRVKRTFGEALSAARRQKGMSQQQLADSLPVNRSSVANWEADRRLPDATLIAKISKILNVELSELLDAATGNTANPVVIIVDDNNIVLNGSVSIIKKALPSATVVGFSKPAQAVAYARESHVSLAFLDIELGSTSGLNLCNTILEIDPHTNVVFLTAYPEYSFDAWDTGACGFVVKPITIEGVQAQLKKMRHPFPTGGTGV